MIHFDPSQISWSDVIGVTGTTLIALAYFLQQLGRMTGDSLAYLLMNLAGAILLMVSLCVNFNLASFLMEIFWIIASLIGLSRTLKRRDQGTSNSSFG